MTPCVCDLFVPFVKDGSQRTPRLHNEHYVVIFVTRSVLCVHILAQKLENGTRRNYQDYFG